MKASAYIKGYICLQLHEHIHFLTIINQPNQRFYDKAIFCKNGSRCDDRRSGPPGNGCDRPEVVDESGAPVIGAAVVVVGNTAIGAVTDASGAFRLNVPAGASINVSCIGYADQTLSTANQSVFNIVLREDTEFLDETVVIGYGVQKKSDLTGAVASVRDEDLRNRSTSDAAAALMGKAAGVQVVQASGAPGKAAAIRVRGYSSNSGNIGPLLIVDGLKVDNIQYLDPEMIRMPPPLPSTAPRPVTVSSSSPPSPVRRAKARCSTTTSSASPPSPAGSTS